AAQGNSRKGAGGDGRAHRSHQKSLGSGRIRRRRRTRSGRLARNARAPRGRRSHRARQSIQNARRRYFRRRDRRQAARPERRRPGKNRGFYFVEIGARAACPQGRRSRLKRRVYFERFAFFADRNHKNKNREITRRIWSYFVFRFLKTKNARNFPRAFLLNLRLDQLSLSTPSARPFACL